MKSIWIILPALATILACTTPNQDSQMNPGNKMIQVEGTVTNYTENVMEDHLEDGLFVRYHATEIQIHLPENYSDEPLIVHHSADEVVSQLWKEAGKNIRFSIDSTILGSDVIFQGAVEKLEELD